MRRRAPLLVLLVFALAVPLFGGTVPVDAQQDRFFPDTGFAVTDDAFWNYFQHRGGVDTFGQPVSRKFVLMGAEVQFFQRLVMQKRPDGSVTTLNLLDAGLMPVTHINGSTFPSPRQSLTDEAPTPADADYGAKIVEFVRDNAPDDWQDLPVNFLSTFNSVVSFDDAFPDGQGDAGLLPLLNLEVWGAPTSEPARDPANNDFVYQRFQRVIAHYDRGCGCTRALLLADWFKSVITGNNLPPDLAAEMQNSPFYQQYDQSKPNSLARSDALQATNMAFAFEREDRPVSGTPSTQPTSAPAGDTIAVLSSDLAQDPTTKHWIGYGEVQNNSSTTVTASVRLNVFDLNERPLAVNEEEVSVSPLAPGQVSPFYLDFGRLPNGVDHFTTEARSAPPTSNGVSGLRVSGKRDAEDEDRVVVTGTIENRSGDHAKDVRLAVSFYNEDGELLDVWQGTPVFTTVRDGQHVAFQAETSLSSPRDVESYVVYVVGFRGLPSPELEDDVAELKSSRIEVDEGNTLHVLGEVSSTTGEEAADVTIAAVFYDIEDEIVGAGSAKPIPVRVPPETSAPFEMELHAPPNGYDHVEYTVLGQPYKDRETWPHPLDLLDETFTLSGGRATVSGSVHNDTDDDIHDVFVVVTYYNSTDKVVDIASRNLDDPDLGEGDEEAFELSSRVSGIESAKVRGYGYRD